jgi:glycosyltransferase involved in cell wall biosynthesis
LNAGRDELRVTHVVLSLDVGGLERNVVNQVREGHKLGQRVSILCVERPGALAPRAEELGARVVCVDKPPGLRPGIVWRIRRALAELRPDVIHTHQVGPLFYTGLATRGLRPPLIVHTEHGKEDYAGRAKTRVLGKLAGRWTRRFYCLTDDMAAAVVGLGVVPQSKARVIQNGIDVDAFTGTADGERTRRELGIPAGAPVIGTVGRLNEIKRQDVLLRAFAKVRAELSETRLLLVGDGPLRQQLEALAKELGIAPAVHFAGYQPSSASFLQAMNVFALTSRSEGMPQAVLEAAVAKLPIIASRVGGLPEVIQDGRTGLLFEAGDDEALSKGLRELLTNAPLAQRLGAAAHDHVCARFHVRRMAEEYHRDFLELLSGAAPVAPKVGRPTVCKASQFAC